MFPLPSSTQEGVPFTSQELSERVKGPDKEINTRGTRFIAPPPETTPGGKARAPGRLPRSHAARFLRLVARRGGAADPAGSPTLLCAPRRRRGRGGRLRRRRWRAPRPTFGT